MIPHLSYVITRRFGQRLRQVRVRRPAGPAGGDRRRVLRVRQLLVPARRRRRVLRERALRVRHLPLRRRLFRPGVRLPHLERLVRRPRYALNALVRHSPELIEPFDRGQGRVLGQRGVLVRRHVPVQTRSERGVLPALSGTQSPFLDEPSTD